MGGNTWQSAGSRASWGMPEVNAFPSPATEDDLGWAIHTELQATMGSEPSKATVCSAPCRGGTTADRPANVQPGAYNPELYKAMAAARSAAVADRPANIQLGAYNPNLY